jgi:hypothetical protein
VHYPAQLNGGNCRAATIFAREAGALWRGCAAGLRMISPPDATSGDGHFAARKPPPGLAITARAFIPV